MALVLVFLCEHVQGNDESSHLHLGMSQHRAMKLYGIDRVHGNMPSHLGKQRHGLELEWNGIE